MKLRLLENLLWASILCLSCPLWLILNRGAERPRRSRRGLGGAGGFPMSVFL